jgi:Arc/MetJ-type ribon-helix-helix transcriptional regulator
VSTTKERVTVTLDSQLLAAANAAVADGLASSVSAWINTHLSEALVKQRRLAALDRAISEYEAEHGAFTTEELEAQRLADHRNSIKIRRTKRSARVARPR